MGNRKESSFISLTENENKTIIIPIIQRDYAQGRNDESAVKVRERLIDDWISVLSDNDTESKKRMDFNFIYGEESKYGDDPVFFPVDGQQRLTSLYLLHWYLAFETGNESEIKKWNFDYKTRNSASEFFAFMKGDKAHELYRILKYNKNDLKGKIWDEEWYKIKWRNDPTVNSCIEFLLTLSQKLSVLSAKNKSVCSDFWKRLTDPEDRYPIYFTYLAEESDQAEVKAARTYTRMNARGKHLTDFENLKAMIDELESRVQNAGGCDHQISYTFDRLYIDYFYDVEKKKPLADSEKEKFLALATSSINKRNLNWFKTIFFIYSIAVKRSHFDYSVLCNSYENKIYQLSQGRETDDDISEYLTMLKAVFESLCCSDGCLDDMAVSLDKFNPGVNSNEVIAFVLFAYKTWKKVSVDGDLKTQDDAQKQINKKIAEDWKQFNEKVLGDLCYKQWQCGFVQYASFVIKLIDGYKSYAGVSEFFIKYDFVNDYPFVDIDDPSIEVNVLSDIRCRILECKIMWHLISAGKISEAEIRAFSANDSGRTGYLYYLCGYMNAGSTWKADDWSSFGLPSSAGKIRDYISIFEAFSSHLSSPGWYSFDYELKAIYAYVSQYDLASNSLKPENVINACKKDHVWKSERLKWDDGEYGDLNSEKITQFDQLGNMLEMTMKFKQSNPTDLCESFYSSIKNSLGAGYEDCWLRFALSYGGAGLDILNNELDDSTGHVQIIKNGERYDAMLLTYLNYNKYTDIQSTENYKLSNHLKVGDRYFVKKDVNTFKYADFSLIFTFDANTPFPHSSDHDKDFETGINRSNLELEFVSLLSPDFLKGKGEQYISFEKNSQNEIEVCRYERSGRGNGYMQISVEKTTVDRNMLAKLDQRYDQWKKEIEDIITYPVTNPSDPAKHDKLLELRAKDDSCMLGIKDPINTKADLGRGGSKTRRWFEITTIAQGVNLTSKTDNF